MEKEICVFLNDLRYALRRLAKSPGYVAMAVMALALGIGANANVFSFVNAYLLHPLPAVKDLDRIVLFESQVRANRSGTSYLDYVDFVEQSRSFDGIAATTPVMPILSGRGEAERVIGAQVSANYFDVFTVQPATGRAFLSSEINEPVVLISDRFWQKRFGSSPGAIGQSLVLDNVSFRIIGVMPPRFRSEWNDFDIWRPLSAEVMKSSRGRRTLNVFGRLKPGVSLAAAQQEIAIVAKRLEMQYPETNAQLKANVYDFVERLSAGPRQSIDILVWVVAFVLLIACSNVANLQLARATGRANEIAIRIAMGASRWRIIRQVIMESTIVSLLGGALGLALAIVCAKLLLASLPPQFQPINKTLLDGYVVAYTAAIALATGIVSGIAPAFQVSRVGVNEVLKEGGRGNTSGLKGRFRSGLVVVEMTLALVLLLASGLLIQSFVKMQDIHPGFRSDRLLVAQLYLPEARYTTPEQRGNFYRALVERAAALPGVRAAASTTGLPLYGGGGGGSVIIEGQPVPAGGSELSARVRSVSASYLQTMGIGLRKGRDLAEQDAANGLRVALVNERFAQQFLGKTDPVGKRFKFGRNVQSESPWVTIVGVTADVKPASLTAPPLPEVFLPVRQDPRPWGWIVVRTESADPTTLAPALRAEVRALDRDQPVTDLRSMDRIIEESMTLPRLMAVLMTIFAAIAMAMAAMGIYGVISYSVAQRTHEFGIRMALGAGSPSVIRLVLRQALWMLGLGIGIGIPAAALMTKALQAWLYGVGARDPLTFVAIPLLLAAIGAVASYIPARRATRVDPAIALRCE
jgi:putative ABC transport system permease protein